METVAANVDDLQIPGYRLVLTSAHLPLIDEVQQMHATLLAPTFAAHETEEVELFVERLLTQHKLHSAGMWGRAATVAPTPDSPKLVLPEWEFHIAMLIDSATNHVVGAAVHELYLRSGCGLVSYLVVSESMRGKGVAGRLMEAAFRNCTAVMAANGPDVGCDGGSGKVLHAMFVEVLQVCDDEVSASDPTNTQASTVRQQVFKRLKFVALDMDLVHPGRMKGHRYNLSFRSDVHVAVHQQSNESVDALVARFPVVVLMTFMTDLFAGILADEGKADDTDIDEYRKAFAGREYLPAGNQFWR